MTVTELSIAGTCDPRFEAVRTTFRENFETRGDVGASVAITLDGEPVVDLWGGWADGARTQPWEQDTIVNVYSATKGVLATCMHMLVDRGLLDLDAPVASYWPEFAQAGKQTLPVRYLLSHQRRAGARTGRGGVRLAHDDPRTRGTGAMVGARHEPGLPRRHLRLVERRGPAPDHGPDVQPLRA